MIVLKQKQVAFLLAVIVVVLVGAYAYVASLPTAEDILRKRQQEEFQAKSKEFQRTLTWVQDNVPRVIGYPRFTGTYNKIVVKETYETLVRYEGSSTDFKPALAEKWEISPDGKIYTFLLRKGVKFYPSGDPFNAESVKFSFDDAFSGSPYTSVPLFGGTDWVQYDKCEIVDEYTVKIYLKKPISWFMRMAAFAPVGAIMNPRFIKSHGGSPKTEADLSEYLIWHQDVTGPYIVDEFKPGDRVILKRNPTYWMGWSGELANRPERVVIRVVPETATRMMLMARGDADIAYVDVPYLPELKRRIETERLPLTIDEEPTLRGLMIVFDHLNPPTNDVYIRRALAWSFNYDEYIKKVLLGYGDQLISFVPKGIWGYQPNVPHYTFDLGKAKAELALALPENRAMLEKGIKITYTSGYALGKEGYMMWKSDLAKIGVNLILDELSYTSYREAMRGGKVPLLDRAWVPDFPDPATFYTYLGRSHYVAKAFGTTPDWVDALFEKAAFNVNQEERLKIYEQVENWSYESVPYIKVASLKGGGRYNVRGTWVKGYKSHVFDDQKPLFYELWKELPAASSSRSIMQLLEVHTRTGRDLIQLYI